MKDVTDKVWKKTSDRVWAAQRYSLGNRVRNAVTQVDDRTMHLIHARILRQVWEVLGVNDE